MIEMMKDFLHTFEQSVSVAMLGLCLDKGVKVKGDIKARLRFNPYIDRYDIEVMAWDNYYFRFFMDLDEIKRYSDSANISVVLREALMPFVMKLKEDQLILELSGIE